MNLLKTKWLIVHHWESLTLACILVFGALLRFYNYPFRYGLGDETVRDAAVAVVGSRDMQLPLTGPFSSAGPFTFGPWYYYQLIFAKTILPLPHAPWIYLSLASVACIFLSYKIGQILISKKFGLILAFLSAISSSLILSGTHLTNPNLSNLFAFLSIYLFLKIAKQKVNPKWGLALGLSLGIAVNIHYQMMGLLFLPVLLFILSPKKISTVLYIVAGIFVTFIPLLLFDLNNHWFNSRNLLYYYTEGRKLIYVPNRWLFYLRDFWPSYIEEVTGIPPLINGVISIIFLCVVSIKAYQRKLSKLFLVLIISFGLNFLLLRYYWGERYFGYLNYLRPYIIIFEGYFLFLVVNLVRQQKIKLLILGLMAIFLLVFNVPRIAAVLGKDLFTMQIYSDRSKLLKMYPNDEFLLYICPGPGNTSYSAQENSLLYVLDSEHKISQKGRPITYLGKGCNPPGMSNALYDTSKGSGFKRIPGTDIVELGSHSTASISAMGWQKHSLNLIYNTTTRWWFWEQP